jgi:hypothetical protein
LAEQNCTSLVNLIRTGHNFWEVNADLMSGKQKVLAAHLLQNTAPPKGAGL